MDSFLTVISGLDKYFDFVTPLFWRAGWVSLLFFPAIGFALWRVNKKREARVSFAIFIVLIISLSSTKVADATNSVFFSGGRMYLGYPYLFLLLMLFLTKMVAKKYKKRIFYAALILSLVSASVKFILFDEMLTHALRDSAYSVVEVVRVDSLKSTCADILDFTNGDADLVMANSGSTKEQIITYGCPCLEDSFPTTFQPSYERRAWSTEQKLATYYQNILWHGSDSLQHSLNAIPGVNFLNVHPKKDWIFIESELKPTQILNRLKPIKDN